MRNAILKFLFKPTNLRRRLAITYTAVTSAILLTLFLAILIADNGGVDNIGENTLIFFFMTIATVAMVSVLGVLFGFVASRELVKRVQVLDTAANSWADGNFTVQVADDATDEIGQLGQKLNGMARQLDTLIKERVDLAGVEERNRIARDLHDSVKQQLFASSMQISSARTVIKANPERADEILHDVEQLVEGMQSELTTLIQMLRPAFLQEQGLTKAVESYVQTWSRQTGIPVALSLQYQGRLPTSFEQTIYRVAQESLANVARHANATGVRLALSQHEQILALEISDNGSGFVPGQSRNGFGLQGMKERLEELGGSVVVTSEPAKGTTVIAKMILPIRPKVVDNER